MDRNAGNPVPSDRRCRWAPGYDAPPLDPGHVHLWWADLDAIDPTGLDLPLDASEQARAATFRFPRDAHRYRMALWMRRSILGRCLGKAPSSVRFQAGTFGKPEIADAVSPSRLRFNASHSGGTAILALTLDDEIGVDVEVPPPVPDLAEIPRDFFHPLEWHQIDAGANEAEKVAAFYRCWTRKEALTKAVGLGLNLPFNCFAVDVTETETPTLIAAEFGTGISTSWTLRDCSRMPNAYAALAISRPPSLVAALAWSP